jgi:uncharacterized protein YndB with AHSA1/START domain
MTHSSVDETIGLRLTRLLPATPEEVFDAYTDPEQQKIWFSILDQEPGIVEITSDLRVGGQQTAVWDRTATHCSARPRPSSRSTDRDGWSRTRWEAAPTGKP